MFSILLFIYTFGFLSIDTDYKEYYETGESDM